MPHADMSAAAAGIPAHKQEANHIIIIPYTVYIVLFPDLHKLLYIKVIYKGSLKGPHDFPVQACHMNINMQLNTTFPQPAGIAQWLEWQGSVDSSMVRVPDS